MSIKFGDKKKASTLLKQFSGTTTMHGFRYILGESCNWKLCKTWRRWLWRIFFALCVSLVISGIYQIVAGYLREPTQVVTSFKFYADGPQVDPLFPADMRITICKRPSWGGADMNQTILSKYGFMALGSPLFSVASDELDLLDRFGEDLSDQVRLPKFIRYMEDTRKRYKEMMESGYDELSFITNFSLSCRKVFENGHRLCGIFQFVLSIRGPCYTKVYKDTEPFVIEFESSKSQALPEAEGFFAAISHPLHRPVYLDSISAVYVPPGSYVNLDVMLSITKRHALYTSWFQTSTNCPALPKEIEPDEVARRMYSITTCNWMHEMYHTEKLRNCSSVLREKKINMRYCSPEDIVIGYNHWKKTNKGDVKARRQTICKNSCTEYEYSLNWKIMNLSGNRSLSQLDFTYNRDQFYLKEYVDVSLIAVISQIGGFLGLYLGASIITLVELVQFIFKWCWYRVGPRRKQRVVCVKKLQKLDGNMFRKLTKY